MSNGQHPSDADEAGQALWQVCLDELAQEIPEQQFNTQIGRRLVSIARPKNSNRVSTRY